MTEFQNQQRVAIVTGGAQGIGHAIAQNLAEAGDLVVVLDLPGASLDALVDAEVGLVGIACDVRSAEQVDAAIAEIIERFGRIDVLVNNAGINVEGELTELSDAQWERCFDVNVFGVVRMCRAVAPHMRAAGWGRIINAASFAAVIPSVGSAAYAASKSAVVQLTRVLASELGPFGITANAYAPGMVPSAMNGFAQLDAAGEAAALDMLSVRRWGVPGDVANLIRFLASDQAEYITGALIDVSGGKFATQNPGRATPRETAGV